MKLTNIIISQFSQYILAVIKKKLIYVKMIKYI